MPCNSPKPFSPLLAFTTLGWLAASVLELGLSWGLWSALRKGAVFHQFAHQEDGDAGAPLMRDSTPNEHDQTGTV